MTRVLPKNDAMRKMLKHPTGVGFRESGPANWPNDAFTTRRIRDGDVTVVKDEPKKVERKSTYDAGKTASSKGE